MKKILIIEDDPAVSAGITEILESEHYVVTACSKGKTGLEKALANEYDLIILDLILPDLGGFDICKKLRESGVHSIILMLTAKKDEIDKVVGLEIGADEYVTKPFAMNVLLAQVRALLRRNPTITMDIEDYSFGDIQVNFKTQEVVKNNKKIDLSATEMHLLQYFVQHEGEVIDRNKLLEEVWGYDNYPTTRTVDNFIASLRKKIEADHSNPKHLITKHKIGYKFIK